MKNKRILRWEGKTNFRNSCTIPEFVFVSLFDHFFKKTWEDCRRPTQALNIESTLKATFVKVLQFWGFWCFCQHTLRGQRHGRATWMWQNALGMFCAGSKHEQNQVVRPNRITTKRGSGFQCGNCVIAWQFPPAKKTGRGSQLDAQIYFVCGTAHTHSLGSNNSQGSNVTPPRFNILNFNQLALGSLSATDKPFDNSLKCNEFNWS